jgi:hypothetical protein
MFVGDERVGYAIVVAEYSPMKAGVQREFRSSLPTGFSL